MSTDNIMIDIETFGTSTDAVIVSIGACKFDPLTSEIGEKFHVGVDPKSCTGFGLKMDAATVLWWMGFERDAARNQLLGLQKVDLATALDGFAQWFGPESLPTWGNGASFDNVIMRTAYEKVGLRCPWNFWHDRCYRTIKSLYPNVAMQRTGEHHNALDDAVSQAVHLQEIFTEMR